MMPQKLFSNVQYFAFVVVKMLSVFWGPYLLIPSFTQEKSIIPRSDGNVGSAVLSRNYTFQ